MKKEDRKRLKELERLCKKTQRTPSNYQVYEEIDGA